MNHTDTKMWMIRQCSHNFRLHCQKWPAEAKNIARQEQSIYVQYTLCNKDVVNKNLVNQVLAVIRTYFGRSNQANTIQNALLNKDHSIIRTELLRSNRSLLRRVHCRHSERSQHLEENIRRA